VQQAPQAAGIVIELMKYGIGAFKQAEPLEGTLDRMLEEITAQQQAQAAAPPQPDPEQMKAQADTAIAQQKAQFDAQMMQAKLQADMQIEQMKAQAAAALEEQRQRFEAALKSEELAQKVALEQEKARLDAETKIMVARIGVSGVDTPGLDIVSEASNRLATGMSEDVRSMIQQMVQDSMARDERMMAMMQALMQSMGAPKRIVRGPDGRAMGVEVVTMGNA
jgi:DNA polymerase III gamma/tau subunit